MCFVVVFWLLCIILPYCVCFFWCVFCVCVWFVLYVGGCSLWFALFWCWLVFVGCIRVRLSCLLIHRVIVFCCCCVLYWHALFNDCLCVLVWLFCLLLYVGGVTYVLLCVEVVLYCLCVLVKHRILFDASSLLSCCCCEL